SLKSKVPVCLYIASYAPGYPWQNGIERSLRKTLGDQCELKTFFMNTKRMPEESSLEKAGIQAIDFIAANNPDVVIVSDDNAVKYVLQKHYKNSAIPFVFCGVNHTGAVYGLPYKNTTGMIEKNPTQYLLKLLFNISPSKTRIAFLASTGTTADRDIEEFNQLADQLGIQHQIYQIRDENEWRTIYKQIQQSADIDLIYFSNRASFKTWDHQKNMEWALKHNHKISFTTQDGMMPYVAIGINKIPDEQGTWAGLAALEILNGTPANQIAVVPNQSFQLWVNKQMAMPFEKMLPENLFSQSIIYDTKALH
ncbi:MAG: ABC transporter substrate binding protein, partial [Thiomicrorhabdus sp.]|nr:ABC transporter substrate binding protein [Thiomicrorhabdus sp.]